jgi:hypothetical protein
MLSSRSTKNSAPTLGVDKIFIRQILHVLKDNDLSLNIWFRRRNMGYAKKRKNIYGHIKVQVQKNKMMST